MFLLSLHRIEKLEKELGVQCRKNGWTDVHGELGEYEKGLQGERNAEKMNLQRQLVKIHNGVRKFQRQLIDVKPTPECKFDSYSVFVLIVNNCLLCFSAPLSFEELLKEERTCRQEIAAYEKRIETLSTKPPARDLPAEVRALESFLLKTGGACGGWDQYDHQAFLKVWTKHSGQPAYRKEAKLYLPGKTLEEMERHEDWHQELIYLQGKKREVDHGWKSTLTHLSVLICVSLNVFSVEKRFKHIDVNMVCALFLGGFQEERRRQLEVKLTIEEQLRLRRAEEEEQQRGEKEEEQRELDERRREGAKVIKRFNERVDAHVSRDPSRLTRPTKGWEERMKHIGSSGGGPVLQMFHRAVPTWRQGL
uniref:Coiled-coil domain containing 112 n=1 Tax=Cyclopterus lumpus TaxID=8103 RepID=A0A8C2WHC3_CYCLU